MQPQDQQRQHHGELARNANRNVQAPRGLQNQKPWGWGPATCDFTCVPQHRPCRCSRQKSRSSSGASCPCHWVTNPTHFTFYLSKHTHPSSKNWSHHSSVNGPVYTICPLISGSMGSPRPIAPPGSLSTAPSDAPRPPSAPQGHLPFAVWTTVLTYF